MLRSHGDTLCAMTGARSAHRPLGARRLATIVTMAVAVLGVATGGLSASTADAAAKGARSLGTCKAPKNERGLDNIAAESYRKEYGGTLAAARRWMVVQAAGMQLIERIEASRAREDYMRLSFADKPKKIKLKMRNHRHARAIRRCTRQMGVNSYLRIGLAQWSDADIDRAIVALYAAFPDPNDTGINLFGLSASDDDFYRIDVYPEATDEQYRRIEAKAKEIGVGYRIRRNPDGPDIAEAATLTVQQ